MQLKWVCNLHPVVDKEKILDYINKGYILGNPKANKSISFVQLSLANMKGIYKK